MEQSQPATRTLITEDYAVVAPAYGRDYKNKAAITAAFHSGEDFEMLSPGHGGMYCSSRDFAMGTKVQVRYNQLRSVCIIAAQGTASPA